MQPRVQVELRKTKRAMSFVSSSIDMTMGGNMRIAAFHLNTVISMQLEPWTLCHLCVTPARAPCGQWCTWCEESISHLQGDAVPCLLFSSDLKLAVERLNESRSVWLRLLPDWAIARLSRVAVERALEDMQAAVADALVGEYEDWSSSAVPIG